MTYAYDDYVLMPTKDLYDTAVMKMAIEAAKDMYDKGQALMENFYKTYGDFMSPFAKDMEQYGAAMNRVRLTVNDAYARGIDLFKSPEGRMLVSLLSHSIDPLWYNSARQNAKVGYAYLDAAAKLRAAGKYSEAQELFDIAQNGGTQFGDFQTLGENGLLNMWNRPSPVEAMTLRDFTSPFYSTRTARDLTKLDVESVPGYVYDPRYNYSGYLKQDALAAAPGIANALEADPRFKYFKEQAKQQARLLNPTASEADIEKMATAQLYENIAESGRTYFIDPTKKADEFALDDYRTQNDIKASWEKEKAEAAYKDSEGNGGSGKGGSGYNIPEDVYTTSLAKAAGVEYLPQGGVTPNMLSQMVKDATKRQNAAIRTSKDVLLATGMFIAPEKVSGLIQSSGKNGNGHFLNPNYFKNLHDIDDMRTSYKGWMKAGSTAEQSKTIRAEKKQRSKDIIAGIKDWKDAKNKGFKLKVVPVTDENDNNVYGMVGEDGKWHTYARVRVYMSNGKETTDAGAKNNVDGKQRSDIPKDGREMVLEIGLHSNEGKGTPDLSNSAREELGFYGFDATKKKIGMTGNSGWPYGTNIISNAVSDSTTVKK